MNQCKKNPDPIVKQRIINQSNNLKKAWKNTNPELRKLRLSYLHSPLTRYKAALSLKNTWAKGKIKKKKYKKRKYTPKPNMSIALKKAHERKRNLYIQKATEKYNIITPTINNQQLNNNILPPDNITISHDNNNKRTLWIDTDINNIYD